MTANSGGTGGAVGADVRALRAWTGEQREAMIDDLRAYVSVESPSDDKPSLRAMLDWLEHWLADRLGPPARVRRFDGGDHGDIVVHDYPGTSGDGAGDEPAPVVLLCHYDTVWPLGTLAERPFTVDGDHITGPGVFDMKAGLVQAVWALRALEAAGAARPALRLVLNGDEEIGSLSSRPVIEAETEGARCALVFEASADGAVKTARKGVGLFELDIEGVEAHAGLDPASGASAVDELARAVLELHALSDPASGTTVNVGVVSGGTRSNVTAGHAHANIDVRVAAQSETARIDAALAALTPHDSRASLTVSGGWNRPVMERGPGTTQLYTLARDLAAPLGLELRECAVGGASDGNFAARLGVPVLDGFGAVGDGAHARHEYATVSGLLERTALAAAVINSLA
ncbi:M20 family metallopeptidase [Streptomyces sp. 150FB]|uniref:M20 family metallopeptidase n=1 Tax=Streptomyces sp. 150FB TaxID=1576605 RepID=UPI000A67BFA4|nr:M20 family metallopeptidase [Streptomyces sp. 150FB]